MLSHPTERKVNARTLQPQTPCDAHTPSGPSMTRRSPWSSRIEEGAAPSARRRTWKSQGQPELVLTVSSGEFCGLNKGSLSQCQVLNRRTPVGTSPFAHDGDKRGATLLHELITPTVVPWRDPSSIECFRFPPLHTWVVKIGGRQYDTCSHPFGTQIPDLTVPHTFFQPITCLMPDPRPGDTCWGVRNPPGG